jgi:hypothetical protein
VNKNAPMIQRRDKESQRNKQAVEFAKSCKRYGEEMEIHERGVELRDSTKPEDQWRSIDYKTMIEFKRLTDIQDFRRVNLMAAKSARKKKKKKEKQPKFRPPGIPQTKGLRQIMWEEYKNRLDPATPIPPIALDDDDDINRYSSAEECNEDSDERIDRYSSAEEYSEEDGIDRYSSDENYSYSSAEEYSEDDGIDRYSSHENYSKDHTEDNSKDGGNDSIAFYSSSDDDELFGAGLLQSLKKFGI